MLAPTSRLAIGNGLLFTCVFLVFTAFNFHDDNERACHEKECYDEAGTLYLTFVTVGLIVGLVSLLMTVTVAAAFRDNNHIAQEVMVYTFAVAIFSVAALEATYFQCLGDGGSTCVQDREDRSLYAALCTTATPTIYFVFVKLVAPLLTCGGSGNGAVPKSAYSSVTQVCALTLGITGLMHVWFTYRDVNECSSFSGTLSEQYDQREECALEALIWKGIALAIIGIALVLGVFSLFCKCSSNSPLAGSIYNRHGRVIWFSLVFALLYWAIQTAVEVLKWRCLHGAYEDEDGVKAQECQDDDEERVEFIGIISLACACLLFIFTLTWGRASAPTSNQA